MKAKFLAVVLILSALFVTANQSYACPPPNQDPVAILTADPEYVMKDVNVTLDGSGSYDPDGDIEKYEWDWDYDPCVGFDCNYSETENDPGDDFDGITTHKYSTAGTYTVALRVTDDDNSKDTDTCMVYVNVKIFVPNDVNTIQEAIVDANDGISTIVVSEGTYYENIDFKGKGITVTSTDPNSPDVVAATIITDDPCDPNVHVVTFKTSEDANSVLIGFTITDGDADGSGDEACGGGIYCDNASPTVRNCVIRDNKAAWSVDNGGGGGMYNDNNSNPSIINCVFSRNMASSTAPQTPLGYGGGIYNKESSPDVINCIFWGNFASHIGGGMYNEGLSSPRVINCVFADNYAASAGGGMANVYDIDSPSPTVTNCTFSGNYGGTGGGMFNSGSNAEVTNCIFWGNYGFDHEISPTEDINVSFSDVEGGYDGVSNIDSDPNFVDAVNPAGPDFVFSTWDDGLRIMAYSPCVDAADGNDAPE
ncbi:MAG: PKD domain-containing protein, partial [Candidatus Omnitrophota bacterium]